VIGVVEDFHFASLRDNIESLGLFIGRSAGTIAFRVNTTRLQEVVGQIEEKWDDFAPHQAFQYSFLDERFNEMYKAEQRLGTIFSVFASLAIFIACLGLLALVGFSAEQKTKEIGVRKVLGASVLDIIVLLSREFSKLILVALVIGAPVAWYVMTNWLADFKYRIDLGLSVFLWAGAVSLLVALLTMSYQSIKAAQANPVDSLRYE